MISILNRITSRARKLLILMIIIPLLTAAVAAYMESKKPTTYTATSTVYLGTFSNDYKMDFSEVDKLVKSLDTINSIKKASHGNFNVNDVKEKLVVTPGKTTIGFQYSGTKQKEVKETLTDFTKGFQIYTNKDYHLKKNDLLKTQKEATAITSDQQIAVAKQLLGDARNSLDNLKPAKVKDISDPVAAYSNPLKRGIFGLILGLMLDIVIVVLPEFFREYK
jgi:teichuronic acid biosynthesis protein TuaF